MSNAFYIQEEWITDYKLSGNDLLIFARLASFTLNVGGYNGSIEWLGHSVGTTKRTAINVLEKLEKIGMIERENKFIKCVFQPLAQGEKSAPKGEKISPKQKGEKISPNGAKFSSKGEKISPKYNKENNYTNKCSNSVIDNEPTHTLTHTENFLFDFFKSKIQNEMDESCIRNLAKKFATIEQAKIFAEYCEERKTSLNLGMLCKLHNEIFDKACEWDAQGRPRKVQKQPEQPPQPTPQILPQQETPEISAKEAQGWHKTGWMIDIDQAIRKHRKTKNKSYEIQSKLKWKLLDIYPDPCDIEEINQYLSKI